MNARYLVPSGRGVMEAQATSGGFLLRDVCRMYLPVIKRG